MKIREAILQEHSKIQKDKIIGWIGNKQDRFDKLFHLFMTDEPKVVQRAAWPISDAAIKHPPLILKHFSSLLKKLREPNLHDGVKRNGIRLMENLAIPKVYQGEVMTLCFDMLLDPKEKVAAKAAALTVLGNLANIYPEIKQELITTIETVGKHESVAFHSRAKKVLKKIK